MFTIPLDSSPFFTTICHFKDPGKLWNSKQDRTIGEASAAWFLFRGMVGWVHGAVHGFRSRDGFFKRHFYGIPINSFKKKGGVLPGCPKNLWLVNWGCFQE